MNIIKCYKCFGIFFEHRCILRTLHCDSQQETALGIYVYNICFRNKINDLKKYMHTRENVNTCLRSNKWLQ